MKNILACLVLLALAVVCAAQQRPKQEAKPHPDLTGTWVLDRSKSGGGSKFDSTLVITHRDPELRITRTDLRKRERVTKEYVFYTDGRGESNPMYYGNGKFDSDTKWEGSKVVAYTCQRRYKGARCHGGDSWKWQLSADSQTLTCRTNHLMASGIDAPAWTMDESKLVYRRAP
jgi:hypothetical protein